MSGINKIKKTIEVLPQIARYGSLDIMLQCFIKHQIKISMPSAIRMLKRVAFNHQLISLSANQIGLDQRCFVALKPEIIKPGKWRSYQQQFDRLGITNPEDAYQAVINPKEINSTYEYYYAYEECPSFQGFKFKAKCPMFVNLRYLTQKVFKQYLAKHPIDKIEQATPNPTIMNPQAKKLQASNLIQIPQSLYTTQKLTGFKGRVWDHENRHLNGVLVIRQQICNTEFYLLDQYKNAIQSIATYEDLLAKTEATRSENLKKLKQSAKKQMKQRKQYAEKIKGKQLQNFGQSSFPTRLDDIPEIIPSKAKMRQAKNAAMKKREDGMKQLNNQQILPHNKNGSPNKITKKGNK